MVVNDIRLIFDNPQQMFNCGEIVCGRLRVCLDAPEKLRSIIVKFKGEANTSWTEETTINQDGKKEKVTIHYKDHDLYFENNVKVYGSTGGAEVLPRGEHFFQYSMVLPDHLPASFEGKYGHIRYSVKGILDNPWKHNHEVVTTITLLPHVDLNFDPRYKEPVHREESKNMCCCCCRSGPLTLTTHVPTMGYLAGETIPLTVEVDNASNVKISNVMCRLQQVVSYHSTSPQGVKIDATDAVKFKCEGPVPKRDSRTWEAELRIPQVPASMLQSCSIIDVYYKMTVTAIPRGLHKDLEITFPILIGTVPFIQDTIHHQSMSANAQHAAMSMIPAMSPFPVQQAMPQFPMQQPMPMPMASHIMPVVTQMPVMAAPSAPPSEGYMPLPQQGMGVAPAAPCLYSSPPTYEESVAGDTKK